jgi:hypothetical protein
MTAMVGVAVAGGGVGLGIGLLATAFGFGFRHGIDWDHLAALTDITASQDTPRRSMTFATLYALGHGLVVFTLGAGAIVASAALPAAVDAVMTRVVGITLIALAFSVFVGLVRRGRDFRMRSRWMLVFVGVRRTTRWLRARRAERLEVVHDHEHPLTEVHVHDEVHVLAAVSSGRSPGTADQRSTHRHHHRHVAALPEDPFVNYGRATSFGLGMIHGVGAETPTQLLIFVTAAGVGGKGAGLLVLTCFVVGLLSANTCVAIAASVGYLGGGRNSRFALTLAAVTATASLAIGILFLLGRSTALPAIFGG